MSLLQAHHPSPPVTPNLQEAAAALQPPLQPSSAGCGAGGAFFSVLPGELVVGWSGSLSVAGEQRGSAGHTAFTSSSPPSPWLP